MPVPHEPVFGFDMPATALVKEQSWRIVKIVSWHHHIRDALCNVNNAK